MISDRSVVWIGTSLIKLIMKYYWKCYLSIRRPYIRVTYTQSYKCTHMWQHFPLLYWKKCVIISNGLMNLNHTLIYQMFLLSHQNITISILFNCFSGFRFAQTLVFCVSFSGSLFILLFFFYWSLYCLSFDLCLQITPLVS